MRARVVRLWLAQPRIPGIADDWGAEYRQVQAQLVLAAAGRRIPPLLIGSPVDRHLPGTAAPSDLLCRSSYAES